MTYIESGIPRKVLIAHESPDAQIGGKVGGAAAVALNQSREMHRMGRNIELIGPKNGGVGKLDIPHQLFSIPETSHNDELLETLRNDVWMSFWEQTLRTDENGECDVYGHYYVAGGIMSEMNGAINGKKIYMGHSWDRTIQRMDPNRTTSNTRGKAEVSILKHADAIVTSTEAERQMIALDYQDSVPSGRKEILGKIHVVPLGVDSSSFSPENLAKKRQEHRGKLLKGLGNSLNFYMVGRIAPQKNQLNAVRAFTEMLKAESGLDVSLSIYGGPLDNNKYYDLLRQYIATQPEEIQNRIIFHGVQDADIAHATGDVFLGNSVWETFFLAGAEAMASGKPTIVSDKPILREVAGEGSLYVDETDISDTASKIHRMATDEEIRQYSSTYNFNKAWQQYTWKKSARRLDEVWKSLRK